MGENVLEVRRLSKQYPNFALQDISFTLPKGYIMGYVGQNGAGKTTTLSSIMHLVKADEGDINVDGIRYEEDEVTYKEAIGYIGDSASMMPDFTLKQVRAILKDFYPTYQAQKFDALVKKWKLPEKKKVKDFSRGMRVKLMFAMVLSRETKLLILDEATNGLDPVVRQEILQLLQEYISDGEHSVLFSTHMLSDLEDIADYIFFIDGGRKIFFETKEELQENFVLVKGGQEDLDVQTRRLLIGIQESGMGFEALAKTDDGAYLSGKCLLEKPTIDKIVVHMIKGMEE